MQDSLKIRFDFIREENKTLYISDLDGTLLAPDEKLSPYTLETLNALIDRGLLFSYATARSFATASRATHGLNLRLPVVTNNGVFLREPENGASLHGCFIGEEYLRAVKEHILGYHVPVLVYALIGGEERVSWLLGSENAGIHSFVNDRRAWDKRLRGVKNPEELFAGDVFYIIIIEDESNTARIHRELSAIPGCVCTIMRDVYHRDEFWVELYHREASKAAGIERLKRIVGVDRVICFGDGLNDIPMFRASDESCAMENADGELKRIATRVIGSNSGDGVARWLSQNL